MSSVSWPGLEGGGSRQIADSIADSTVSIPD